MSSLLTSVSRMLCRAGSPCHCRLCWRHETLTLPVSIVRSHGRCGFNNYIRLRMFSRHRGQVLPDPPLIWDIHPCTFIINIQSFIIHILLWYRGCDTCAGKDARSWPDEDPAYPLDKCYSYQTPVHFQRLDCLLHLSFSIYFIKYFVVKRFTWD